MTISNVEPGRVWRSDQEIAAFYERVRLLAVELAELQERGDLVAASRTAAGTSDAELETILIRLARARSRLESSVEFDRTQGDPL